MPGSAFSLIFSLFLAAKKIGVTATSELYEWATKKGFLIIFLIFFIVMLDFSPIRGLCGFQIPGAFQFRV